MTRTRREFPNSVKRAARDRAAGVCECHRVPQLPTFCKGCGCKLGPGNIFYEHIDPDGLCGEPSLLNCAVLVKTCWRIKTNGYDIPKVAQAKRREDRHSGIARTTWRPMAGTKASGIKLSLRPYSRPIDRRTGQPLRR